MARLRRAVAEKVVSRAILFGVVFIGLNILDAWLTKIAIGAGSYELNPFLGMRFGGNILFKGLLSAAIVAALVLFKQYKLLKPLSLGMALVCVWNGLALWSWL